MGYGLLPLNAGRGLDAAQDLGFNWIKLFTEWSSVQPTSAPTYSWSDSAVNGANARAIQVLMRLDGTPGWARDGGCNEPDSKNYPPRSNAEFAEFAYQTALHWRGKVAAYEIWNEPNVADEWGGCNPDPVRFTNLLAAVYPRLKQGDPNALLVTGGLSNTGDGSQPGVCDGQVQVCGDLLYLQQMYTLGGGHMGTHWDALGAHPYGGPNAPDASPSSHPPTGLYFRRMDDMRNIINDFGHESTVPIWATEMGWLTDFDRGCSLDDGGRLAQKVSLAQQGDYLVGAFTYAQANMPWIGPMFIFNLDWNVGFGANCENGDMFRWFSILNEIGGGTSAYQKLKNMAKVDRTPPQSSMSPLLAYSRSSYSVAWSAVDNPGGSGVASYDVQRRIGSGTWADLVTGTSGVSVAVAGTDGEVQSFHVRARDGAGNTESYRDVDASTTIDALAPSSAVNPFGSSVYSTTSVPVSWSGSDARSGMASYDIQVRDGSGSWANWLTATTATNAGFTGVDRHTYAFRSRARDVAGNVEDYPATADGQALVSTSPYLQSGASEVTRLLLKGGSGQASLRLTNLGGTGVTWSASSSDTGVAIPEPASGTLAPGTQTDMVLALSAPPGGVGTVEVTATVTITASALWQGPLSIIARVVAADTLRRTFFPVVTKGFTGGW